MEEHEATRRAATSSSGVWGTRLISTTTSWRTSTTSLATLKGDFTDTIVGVCEMRGRISRLSTLCKCFPAVVRRCDVERFLNIGRLYPEIDPPEKRIDMHIDLLRRGEFRDMECVNDIVKIEAQSDQLAETYFDGFDTDLARKLVYVTAFDHNLDRRF
ncbi:hypothetical protein JR316_0013500 [Psilocybe cubensis]|uniref:Uncharacterized protein n=1 Tax=Psilocybe cubensis TaxID=181762 RepID=A0ACB8GFS3_PSICU|nr:uncharacterized protein JR316_0013500 [Psilocybe cubensis]KAH9474227.1 hypothetical protein JR316_0013500 [Psilocybe cubensis]